MYRAAIFIFLVFLLAGCVEKVEKRSNGFDHQKAVAASEQIVNDFQTELKSHLLQALSEAGNPAGAMHVCSEFAPDLADRISTLPGVSIKRVSLKQRNQHFSPDSFEVSILERFATANSPDAAVYSKVFKESGSVKTFRYMQEIKTGQLCLKCHGNPDLFTPSLIDALNELYPTDEAVNYQPGESRGAFSLILTYPEAQQAINALLSENGK